MATQPTIKTLWGIAKSPELRLSDEELHLIVQKYTGKESIKALNKRELATVAGELLRMKGGNKKSRDRQRYSGNQATENQRKKIYCLTQELGWEQEARVNGMCKKMFSVNSVKWLNYQQCSKLIEALKNMVEREKKKMNEGLQCQNNCQK